MRRKRSSPKRGLSSWGREARAVMRATAGTASPTRSENRFGAGGNPLGSAGSLGGVSAARSGKECLGVPKSLPLGEPSLGETVRGRGIVRLDDLLGLRVTLVALSLLEKAPGLAHPL